MEDVRKCGGVVCVVRISWERRRTAQTSAGSGTANRSMHSKGNRPLLLGTNGSQKMKISLAPVGQRKSGDSAAR